MATNEKLEKFQEKVVELLSDNRVPEAIRKLKKLYRSSSDPYYDDLILFARQYRDLSDRQMSGLIDDAAANIEKNRITHGLISIVHNISDDPTGAAYFGLEPPKSVIAPKVESISNRRIPYIMWLIPVLLVVIVAIYQWRRSNDTGPNEAEKASVTDPPHEPAFDNSSRSDALIPVTFAKSTHSDAASARTLTFNQLIQANLLSKKDQHYYLFTASENTNVNLILANQNDEFRPRITLFDLKRNGVRLFQTAAKEVGGDVEKLFTARAGHQYQVLIEGYRAQSQGAYQLLITYPE